MLERSTITEQFSSFVELADDRFSRWVSDSQLKRNIQSTQARANVNLDRQSTRSSTQFWVIYWYKRWRSQGRSRRSVSYSHLTAFVQEACYWAAQRTTRFSINQYGLADYFQLAIARFDRVLQHFSPTRGSRLEAYAYTAFCNIIRDTLRQRKELDICSDWALLRRISQKRLEEALKAEGRRDIAHYILAWRCYKLVYTPLGKGAKPQKLGPPGPEVWQAIVCEFNQQRQAMTPMPPSSDTATLAQWLHHSVVAVRAYLYPKATSLNIAQMGRDSGEIQDVLIDLETDSPLNLMVAVEEASTRQQQQGELNQVLQTALQQLSPEARDMLRLYYQAGQTQAHIAQTLDLKQYTVSRRLGKARESLLEEISLWSRDTLHISLTSAVVKDITATLEEWLYSHYAAQPQEILQNDPTESR